MTLSALLEALRANNIKLTAEGDRLLVDAPAGAVTGELAAAIKANKAGLLELLGASLDQAATEAPLTHADNENNPSLTQSRIWSVDQLYPDSGQFNLPGSWWLAGTMDEAAFVLALEAFAARHEVLQRRFELRDGKPMVTPPVHAGIEIIQVGLDETGAQSPTDEALADWLEQMAREPFVLETDPLLRVYLVTAAADSHLLLVVSHSAVWDAWCYDIFLDELGRLYHAGAGEPPPLPAYQYADFVAWQRDREREGVMAQAVTEALERVSGAALKRASLSVDYADADGTDHSGARFNFLLPDDLRSAIKTFARNNNVTPFMVALAAYCAVLARFSRQHLLTLTIPLRGRDRPEFETILGPFTNNLFLPVDTQGHSFASLLQLVRTQMAQRMGNNVPPFESLLESLDEDLDLGATSLFQLQFSYQSIEDRTDSWSGELALKPGPAQDFHATHADISFWLRDFSEHTDGAIDYRTAMFREETIEQFLQNVFCMLRQGIANPAQKIAAMDLLSSREREQFLARSQTPFAPGFDLPQAICEGLEKDPQETVLVSSARHWTRGQLLTAVAELQTRICQLTRPGDGVRMDLESGPGALIGALATLLSGCWLVLGQAPDSDCVVTLGEDTDGAQGLLCIDVDSDADSVPLAVRTHPDSGIRSAQGEWPMEALNWAVAATAARFPAGESVLLARRQPEVSLVVLWLAALGQGPLQVPALRELENEFRLAAFIRSNQPEAIHVDSELTAALLDLDANGVARRLFVDVEAGTLPLMSEAASRGMEVTAVLAVAPGPGLLGSVDQGRIVFTRIEAGLSVAAVDDNDVAQPAGVDALLRVDCLLDAVAVAVPDPGLLVRRLADGRFIWTDSQPPGQQEMMALRDALAAIPEVLDVHVEQANGSRAQGAMTCWVRLKPRQELTASQIHRRLEVAPQVPVTLVCVDEIPRDRSGQVIRRELYDPAAILRKVAFEPPAAGFESEFADIWREVLKLETISAQDNFVDLGGTSVQALVILRETRTRLGWAFEPRLLFFQSLRQIAERAEADNKSAEQPAMAVPA